MLTKLIKTAKFLSGWLDWSLLYPLMQSKKGREQVVRYLLGLAKKHPETVKELQRMADAIMAQEMLNGILQRFKQAKDTGQGMNLADILGVDPPDLAGFDPFAGAPRRGRRAETEPEKAPLSPEQTAALVRIGGVAPFHACFTSDHYHDAEGEAIELRDLLPEDRKLFPDFFGGSGASDADDFDDGAATDLRRGVREENGGVSAPPPAAAKTGVPDVEGAYDDGLKPRGVPLRGRTDISDPDRAPAAVTGAGDAEPRKL